MLGQGRNIFRPLPQRRNTQIDDVQPKIDAMSGNICRCGTYVRIREAIKRAAGNGGRRQS